MFCALNVCGCLDFNDGGWGSDNHLGRQDGYISKVLTIFGLYASELVGMKIVEKENLFCESQVGNIDVVK